jgi:hypothetical protein
LYLFGGFLLRWLIFFAGCGGFFLSVLCLGRIQTAHPQKQTQQESENLLQAKEGVEFEKLKVSFHATFSLIALTPRFEVHRSCVIS